MNRVRPHLPNGNPNVCVAGKPPTWLEQLNRKPDRRALNPETGMSRVPTANQSYPAVAQRTQLSAQKDLGKEPPLGKLGVGLYVFAGRTREEAVFAVDLKSRIGPIRTGWKPGMRELEGLSGFAAGSKKLAMERQEKILIENLKQYFKTTNQASILSRGKSNLSPLQVYASLPPERKIEVLKTIRNTANFPRLDKIVGYPPNASIKRAVDAAIGTHETEHAMRHDPLGLLGLKVGKLLAFALVVDSGRPMDFKPTDTKKKFLLVHNAKGVEVRRFVSTYEVVGNVNFGFFGAVLDISGETLHRAAGVAQSRRTSKAEWGTPWDGLVPWKPKSPLSTYGDDPNDYRQIDIGVHLFNKLLDPSWSPQSVPPDRPERINPVKAPSLR